MNIQLATLPSFSLLFISVSVLFQCQCIIRSLVDSKYVKSKKFYVTTKTRNELERARMSWNGLERNVATKEYHQKELGQSVTMVLISYYHTSDRKIQANLEITQIRRAYKDMELRVNSTSCRLKTPSEFLLNNLMLKCCQLVNGL